MQNLLLIERIESKILQVREQKVILSQDIAMLYGVETRRLNEQVKRNIDRFPEEFMFQLTKEEFENLKSQFATSSWGGIRRLPYAFTEHGVLMVANVLNSKRAIEVSVLVIKAFVRIRELILNNEELANKISELEKRLDTHDEIVVNIVKKLKHLIAPKVKIKSQIGFKR